MWHKECIEKCAYRLTTWAWERSWSQLGNNGNFLSGIVFSPNRCCISFKRCNFAANLFAGHGFKVIPDETEERFDIIQAIEFGKPEGVIAFCKGIQAAAPVDSYLTPEPWDMPDTMHLLLWLQSFCFRFIN
ncbi:MAG: methionine gamma-lyase family protein [Eubacterium sp.]